MAESGTLNAFEQGGPISERYTDLREPSVPYEPVYTRLAVAAKKFVELGLRPNYRGTPTSGTFTIPRNMDLGISMHQIFGIYNFSSSTGYFLLKNYSNIGLETSIKIYHGNRHDPNDVHFEQFSFGDGPRNPVFPHKGVFDFRDKFTEDGLVALEHFAEHPTSIAFQGIIDYLQVTGERAELIRANHAVSKLIFGK